MQNIAGGKLMVKEKTELIRVKKSTKDKLDYLGYKVDTYDDIINRLLQKKRDNYGRGTVKKHN